MFSEEAALNLHSRRVNNRAVHERGVVVVFDVVSLLGLLLALVWLVGHAELSVVRGVVEVDDMDVEHQHG